MVRPVTEAPRLWRSAAELSSCTRRSQQTPWQHDTKVVDRVILTNVTMFFGQQDQIG